MKKKLLINIPLFLQANNKPFDIKRVMTSFYTKYGENYLELLNWFHSPITNDQWVLKVLNCPICQFFHSLGAKIFGTELNDVCIWFFYVNTNVFAKICFPLTVIINIDDLWTLALYRKIDKYLQSRETLASEDCLLEMSARWKKNKWNWF